MSIKGLHKEKATVHIGIKVTQSLKDDLDKYCKENDATQSEVVKFALKKLFGSK